MDKNNSFGIKTGIGMALGVGVGTAIGVVYWKYCYWYCFGSGNRPLGWNYLRYIRKREIELTSRWR